MGPPTPRILPCGDRAFVVEFGEAIDPEANAAVLRLDRAAAGLPGIVETVPTYRSLLVAVDPDLADPEALAAQLLALAAAAPDGPPPAGRTWLVPVAYGGAHGIDLEATAERHGLSTAALIAKHSAPTYRVYMIGFLPGFAYLGGLDPALATPRRTSPRLKTPAGTISIGGVQALVASVEAPSGWHLLGRTPVRNFVPARDPPVLIGPGDGVRFRPIDAATFDALDRAAAAGEPVAELVG